MKFTCNLEKMNEITNIINNIAKTNYNSKKVFKNILMDFCHLYYKDNKTDEDYSSLSISMAILLYCDFDFKEEEKKRGSK